MSREMRHSGIEWIGEIPKEWKVARLKNLIQCLDSKRIPMEASQRKKGTYPYWGAGSIMDYVDDFIFDEELVLLGEDGAPFFDRKRNVAFYVNEKVWINNHIHVLRPLNGINAHFLTHFLNIVDYKSYINGSILNKLTQSNMNEICCLVLPENEQQKIANYLDKVCGEVDEMIAMQEQMIEELKAYKQSVITEAVTKGLNPDVPMKDSGIDWIGKVPKHWGTPAISYVATISSGSTPDRNNPLFWKNGDINWIKTGELQNNRISESEEKVTEHALNNTSLKLYPKNTILIAMYGQGKTRGMTALLDVPCTTNQACAALSVRNDNLCCEYLWKCLMGAYDAIREKAVGTGQPNLNSELISKFVITLPPINEQKKIVNYIDEIIPQIDALIAIKQAKIDELKDYKKSVIYEYVTGKKEVV